MTASERSLVSFIEWFFYACLIIITILLLLDKKLFWGGIILVLFLLDRSRFISRAEKTIPHLFLQKIAPEKSAKINAADYFTPRAKNFLIKSFSSAENKIHFYLHLFLSLLKTNIIKNSLIRLDIDIKDLQKEIKLALDETSQSKEPLDLNEAEIFATQCFEISAATGYPEVDLPQIFLGLLNLNIPNLQRIFSHFNLQQNDFKNSLILSEFEKKAKFFSKSPVTAAGFARQPKKIKHRIMNRAWTARPTPFLDQFSQDLTDIARHQQIGLLIGHEAEYDRMVNVLSRSDKNNVLFVGPDGIGKETIVRHLAFDIINDHVPPKLFDKRLVKLLLGELIAGAEAGGELQDRMNKVIKDFFAAGNICFYIPDIHNLMTSSGPYLSIAAVLKPFLDKSDFQIIGSTDNANFKKYLEPQQDFLGSFEIIPVEEIGEEQAKRYLIFEALILERQHKIKISYAAVKTAVDLAKRYLTSKFLPSSAVDLLKETVSTCLQNKDEIISADDIVEIMQRQTNIPIKKISAEEARNLLNLENLIHDRLIDQEEAVHAVAQVLREYRAGIARKGGPIATFLFVGPTGVGKTELAKTIAQIQFGSEDAIVRFDMSGYQDETSIFRFIGSPDTKVSGALSDAVRAKPYCVVLLDEFEKASKNILNLFLPIFDEGKITDNLGNKIDFTSSLIICTSNAHSEYILTELSKDRKIEEVGVEVKKKLINYFPPELINRFNDIIVFKALGPEDTEIICRLQLKELVKTLEKNKEIFVSFEESAIKEVSRLGYNPLYGARPLRNVIQKEIRGLLAEEILKHRYGKGSQIKLLFENGKFIIKEEKFYVNQAPIPD